MRKRCWYEDGRGTVNSELRNVNSNTSRGQTVDVTIIEVAFPPLIRTPFM